MTATRLTLRECIKRIGRVLDPVAAYSGVSFVVDLGSHGEAIRIVREAREALATMREIESGVPERSERI